MRFLIWCLLGISGDVTSLGTGGRHCCPPGSWPQGPKIPVLVLACGKIDFRDIVLSDTFAHNWNFSVKTDVRTIILVAVGMAGLTAQGYAGTTYSLPAGTTDAGGNPVSATAILSLSQVGATEVLTIILENFAQNPISDGQNITGLELNINPAQITGVTLASSSADQIDVAGNGSHKGDVTDLGTGSLSHWTAGTSLSTLTLTTIGSGQATDGIIGAPNSSGDYSNAGGSLTSSTKWPFANQTATFVLDLSGSNISMSSITGVDIGFGTLGTNYILASQTPEPGTFWLLGGSAVMVGLGSRRKRPGNTNPRSSASPAR